MKTLRIKTGFVEHVVHETMTKSRKKSGFVICRPDELEGEITNGGPATCKKCVEMDNPFNTGMAERALLREAAERGRVAPGYAGWGRLVRLDLLNEDGTLTRRGRILADDYTMGPAATCDDAGVWHNREPLSFYRSCDRVQMPDVAKMSVARYAKLRAIAGCVSCLQCLMLMRQT